ncbi:MAG: ComEC family competence protein [Candidatus Staskawiczbacteria bacterium]|nr:ComEC family competence protein [Candidatus Staskawiczbacteria bacterium]
MTSSKALFCFCILFIVGVFTGSTAKIPQIFSWAFLFLGVLVIIISLLIKRNYLTIVGFCLFFFVLGITRLQIFELNIENNQLKKLNDKEEVVLTGKIIGEPDVRYNSQKLKVEIESPKGIALITTGRYPNYYYLDKLRIKGKLKTPFETEDFSYKNYLLKDGIYSVVDFPKIEILDKGDGNLVDFVYWRILQFKQKLRESIRKNYLPPGSSILEGMILGDSNVMSQDLKNKLNNTGLRHIIAVSGTHVVILAAILMSFLLVLGLWRTQAFYISIVFVWLYIILTGLPASGVRAGIMGSIFLLAQKLGRQNTSKRTITMAAALMLFQDPWLLLYDVGFQLSFLASMGIIYLEPFLKNLFKIFTKNKAGNLLNIISTTLAAQIFTLPAMVYNFGNISLISPITNLLILPIVPSLMIFGFLASFLGAVSQFLGQIIFLPCWFLLAYFIKIIDIFSQSFAIKTFENVHWIWLIVFYLAMGLAVYWLQKNRKLRVLEY